MSDCSTVNGPITESGSSSLRMTTLSPGYTQESLIASLGFVLYEPSYPTCSAKNID